MRLPFLFTCALVWALNTVPASVMILAAAASNAFAEKLAKFRPAIDERSVRANAIAAMPYVEKWARLFELPPALLMAMIDAESTFKPRVLSKYGAVGYGQHMPREIDAWLDRLWKWAPKGSDVYTLAKQTARKWTGQVSSLFDVDLNIMLLAWHMRFLIDKFKGVVDTAILAYKIGESAIAKRLRTGKELATTEGWYYLAKIRHLEPIYETALARRRVG